MKFLKYHLFRISGRNFNFTFSLQALNYVPEPNAQMHMFVFLLNNKQTKKKKKKKKNKKKTGGGGDRR